MVHKPQIKRKTEASEADAIDQAARTEEANRQSRQLEVRRFTPASFRSRRKRRSAEKQVTRTKVAGSFTIFGRAIMTLRNHWEIFGGLFLIYALLNTVLTAGSLLGDDLARIQEQWLYSEEVGRLGAGVVTFETLLTTGVGSAAGPAGAYQTLLLIIMSLSIVWALRQVTAGSKIRVRDALYNSTYPLVQVLLVLLMVSLQLLPAMLASYLLYVLIGMQIIVVGWQQVIVYGICFLLYLWTVYMLISSVLALYIATLPGMTPLKALRSAKEIVRYRRGLVLRKLLFLPLVLLVIGAIIIIPVSLVLPVLATLLFFILSMMYLSVVHAYLYALYRELIKTA